MHIDNGMNMTEHKLAEAVDWMKGDGLVPAIVQSSINGRVLMLGYMNKASLEQTLDTGLVTFFSRSRQALWCKGETSGNTLSLSSVALDCDSDTLLVKAVAKGPTCHLGTTTCFKEDQPSTGFGFLGELESTIAKRKLAPQDDSYTAQLFAKGHAKMAQKVGEEGVEVALAAVQDNKQELLEESADLIYHLLVVLASRDLSLEQVSAILRERSLASQ